MPDFEILDEDKRQQLAREKITAREKLLTLPPDKAQANIAAYFNCYSWTVTPEHLTWDDSLPNADDDSIDS